MKHTFETIRNVTLEQLLDEIDNYINQYKKGSKTIYLKELETIDMLYLIRNHSCKNEIPQNVVSDYEHMMIEKEMDALMRYSCEPVSADRYLLHRLVCLSAFYVEKEVFHDFWGRTLIVLRPHVLSEVHAKYNMESISKVTFDELYSAIKGYLENKYPYPSLSLRDIFYLVNTHKDRALIPEEDLNWIKRHMEIDSLKFLFQSVENKEDWNEYHYKVQEMADAFYESLENKDNI